MQLFKIVPPQNERCLYIKTCDMFRRNKENKAKLEHQLYLVSLNYTPLIINIKLFLFKARENPEPIFDLSECSLHDVPRGIYSLCRVFLKETLDLQNNFLHSLSGGGSLKDLQFLKVLNINDNKFRELPDDIQFLINLEVTQHLTMLFFSLQCNCFRNCTLAIIT